MSGYWFYHLNGSRPVTALGILLEKCLERGWRALVVAAPDQLAALDRDLWTYRGDSFLPHGLATDPDPQRQPVLLTASVDDGGAANGAGILTLMHADGIARHGGLNGFERYMILFDDDSKQAARRLYAEKRDMARYFLHEASGWREQTT